MTWDEGKHRRDAEGQFTHTGVGSWVEKAVGQLGGRRDYTLDTLAAHRRGERPRGYSAAVQRAEYLGDVPAHRVSGERTDAEQAELEGLEEAFQSYVDNLGLQQISWNVYESHEPSVRGAWAGRRRYDRFGREIPYAADGAVRVGDDPRAGPRSLLDHPDTGGLWRDRGRGPRSRLVDDSGYLFRPRTRNHKEQQLSRRQDAAGRPDWLDHYETTNRNTGEQRGGRIGYDRAESEGAAGFVAAMRRKKKRAGVEAPPRQPVRRTPKGTQVEGWMGTVSNRIGQRGNGRAAS